MTDAAAAQAPAPVPAAAPAHRSRFFLVMSVLAAGTVVVGFGNVYGAKVAAGATGIPGIIHVHAVVFAAWMAVLIAQTALVARGRVDLHKKVGNLGVLLVVAMLVVGFLTSVDAARSGHRGIPGLMFPTPAAFLMLNFNSLLVFCGIAAAGWWFRSAPQVHKRLMLTATVVGLVPPGASRLPVVGPTPLIVPIVLGFVLAGPIHDAVTRRRRPHAAYWACAAVVLVLPPVVEGLSSTGPWQSLAAWLLG